MTIIMTPGPSEVHPEVLATLNRSQLVHYGTDWGSFYKETCLSLRNLFGTTEQPLLLFGPGSLAMEMAIANALRPGDEAVNVVTGYFGRRWAEVLTKRGIRAHNVTAELGRTVSPEDVENSLKTHKNAKALIAVRVDTSSGVTSPVHEYAEIARKYGVVVIVDAICSFGGLPLRMDEWRIDFLIGYTSKCVSSISGVTPYALSKRFWELSESEANQAGWYMNLSVTRKFIEDWGRWGHPYSTTIPVQPVVALREAIRVIDREGLENYFMKHQQAKLAVRDAARALKLKLVAEDEVAAPTVTPIMIGDGLDKEIRSMLLERYSIEVGGGLLAPMIRIGHMGRSADPQFVLVTVSALEGCLRKLGRSIQFGAAAQHHLT